MLRMLLLRRQWNWRKLALVISKDEEDDIEQTVTDSSNNTDATLVEDALPRAGPVTGSPGAASSSSVLVGQRSRDKEIGSRMSIDSVRQGQLCHHFEGTGRWTIGGR